MKAHIGLDAESGLVHSVVATPANAGDVTQMQHPVTEQVLDHVEQMLDPGAHLRLDALQRGDQILVPALGHRLELAALHRDMPSQIGIDVAVGLRLHDLFVLVHAAVARVGEHIGLLAVQQARPVHQFIRYSQELEGALK